MSLKGSLFLPISQFDSLLPVGRATKRRIKHIARVWLEDLEVECANAVLRDRIRVVVERAIETVEHEPQGQPLSSYQPVRFPFARWQSH
jgi:hypothetical protein